jgi:hypothetical protein
MKEPPVRKALDSEGTEESESCWHKAEGVAITAASVGREEADKGMGGTAQTLGWGVRTADERCLHSHRHLLQSQCHCWSHLWRKSVHMGSIQPERLPAPILAGYFPFSSDNKQWFPDRLLFHEYTALQQT